MAAMRRRRALVLVCCVAVAACGDGINEGVNEGRGTIDSLTLHTAYTVVPESTETTGTDPSSIQAVSRAWT